MTAVHFLCFGDGSTPIRHAADRLNRQAMQTGFFASTISFDFDKLRKFSPNFWRKNGNFLLRHRRGAGYWLWKPFLISEALSRIQHGELLVYADAGCEISGDREQTFWEFLPIEEDKDIAVTVLEPHRTVVRWTNQYCRRRLDPAGHFLEYAQIQSGLLGIKNNERSRELIRRWLSWCLEDDYSLLVDRDEAEPDERFIEHRHDQAILTLIAYDMERLGEIRIKYLKVRMAEGPDFAIPILRNGSPFSMLSGNTWKRRALVKGYRVAMSMLCGAERRYDKLWELWFHDRNAK